ncbi:PQQ-binding-like beta-propeller repeat protein [bacterium]|nr:PQQ-binding-like beta-propeller repeat protein [bacterium]
MIRRLILLACLGAALAAAFLVGFQRGRRNTGPRRIAITEPDIRRDDLQGRWYPTAPVAEAGDRELRRLQSVGYLGGYRAGPDTRGAATLDSTRCAPGLTLVCSGHAPVATLIDRDGRPVHTWEVPFRTVWPDSVPFPVHPEHREFLRRAEVLPNGDLIGLFEYVGIFRVDRAGRVLWRDASLQHHDLQLLPDGGILTLARRLVPPADLEAHLGAGTVPFRNLLVDDVLLMDASGHIRERIPLLEAIGASDFAPILQRIAHPDVFHANSVWRIETPSPDQADLFGPGDILVSLRNISTVVALDATTHRVKWAAAGPWHRQHQAVYLPDGDLLLFDNLGASRPLQAFDRSRVLRVDPLTGRIRWSFGGRPGEELFSAWLGSVQPLPGGNVLVTEAAGGRLLEVAPDGAVVWTYVNPHRAGDAGEFIAVLLAARRVPRSGLGFLATE